MKKMKTILLVAFFMALSIPAFGYDLVLQWDSNTEPDLATGARARYKIYVREGQSLDGLKSNGTATNVLVADDENADPLVVQKTLKNFTDQKVYFIAVTALDEAGNESGLSNEVNTSGIDETPPAVPKSFNIFKWIRTVISWLFGGFNLRAA
jgi:hypothetical protein